MERGKFVISLDLEIYWGIRDAIELEDYKAELSKVHEVVPALLSLFQKYEISTTFATVGFVFFKNKNDLLKSLPTKEPEYSKARLSPYKNLQSSIGENEEQDPYHFGGTLIDKIIKAGQEIGSHTFSHFYCLEKGQTTEDFKADLEGAKKIAAKKGIELKSLVFPRNQYNQKYIDVCAEMGFSSFRGNERYWLFSSEYFGVQNIVRRPFRFLDSYFNLSGYNCYSLKKTGSSYPFNIRSSRFLRPYSKKMRVFENLRLKRIKESMTYAAEKGKLYHLWWHPHNFATNLKDNIAFLEQILIHYQNLNDKWNFESRSMGQIAKELKGNSE
jgi:peptidoglycan/xylan/chitin deacetylase (PgdA/CDA1 family)